MAGRTAPPAHSGSQGEAAAARDASVWASLAGLAPLAAAALLCLGWRFGGAGLGPTDAMLARTEPAPIATMRRLFPTTNPELDVALGRGSGDPEHTEQAVAYFRGWMRTRAYDVLRAPDKPLLSVASARLSVLLAARAEDPRLCVQYARAPAGGVVQPVSAPSPLLAEAVDRELVEEVAAARAGADGPVVRAPEAKPWAKPSVRRRASYPTWEVLRDSPRLARLSPSRQCAGYIGAYRLALGLPSGEGASLASVLLGRALPPPAAEPATGRTRA